MHEHLAVHARGVTRGHPIDLLMISRVRVVAGHIDAASRPAVGCHDEVQVRAAAQSDELAARTSMISDRLGCRRVQPTDLSVKQQCEPSGSTIRRHAMLPKKDRSGLLAKANAVFARTVLHIRAEPRVPRLHSRQRLSVSRLATGCVRGWVDSAFEAMPSAGEAPSSRVALSRNSVFRCGRRRRGGTRSAQRRRRGSRLRRSSLRRRPGLRRQAT